MRLPEGYKEDRMGDDRPQKGLWAPGEYMNRCANCNSEFIGHKRALWCADCAYEEQSLLTQAIEKLQEGVDMLVKYEEQ